MGHTIVENNTQSTNCAQDGLICDGSVEPSSFASTLLPGKTASGRQFMSLVDDLYLRVYWLHFTTVVRQEVVKLTVLNHC